MQQKGKLLSPYQKTCHESKLVPFLYKEIVITEILRVLKLPSLQYRRLRGDLIQVYKMLNNNKNSEYFF